MPLSRVAVIYETEAAARDRLIGFGYAPEIAAEIAVYLGQSTDLPDFFDDIAGAARAEGLTVDFIELDDWLTRLPEFLPHRERTLVWALGDGIRYYRGSSVAALSRLAGFARFGAPSPAQHICQDKFASLALAASAALRIPATRLLEGGEEIARLGEPGQSGPFFVKPNRLGAKIGIFADSRCASLSEARERSERIWARYGDRALVQPYVDGADVRVSFLDLGGAFVDQLGIERLAKDPNSETGGAFMTMKDNETLSGARDGSGARGAFGASRAAAFTPRKEDLKAATDAPSQRAAADITAMAQRLARAIELTDYFSMDFRIDAEGQPTFFEFETGPGVTIYDFQSYLARVHRLTLGQALARGFRRAHARARSQAEA